MDQIAAHEQEITAYALEGLLGRPGLRILGPTEPVDRGGAVSFTLAADGTLIHPHDVSQLLDSRGIAVRGGHHCARPLHERFGIQSSTRASFYLYTTQRRDRRAGRRAGLRRELLRRATMKVEELYQEIILDHYRAKHHSGLREPYEAEVHHVNPTLRGRGDAAGRTWTASTVRDVSYEGVGCSISQASTSVMTDLVIGRDVEHGLGLHEEFLTLMQGQGQIEPDEERLEDGIAFAGVARFPARVKCALLGWSAFKDAVLRAQSARRSKENDDDRHATLRPGAGRPARRRAGRADRRQPTLEDLDEALKDVVDPELGINVVDLGLIYGLHLEDDNSLTIDMTLTSAACPLTDVIEDQTQTALEGLVTRS